MSSSSALRLVVWAVVSVAMFRAPSVSAAVIFADSFEGISAQTILNWNGAPNWTVQTGSVDLVETGDYGIACSGGSSFCVDTDGTTTTTGVITSIDLGPLGVGTYQLSYDLSGNQRTPNQIDGVRIEIAGQQWTHFLTYLAPWQTFTQTFDLLAAVDSVFIGVTGLVAVDEIGDNEGLLLDNVRLAGVQAIPEPGSLLLLTTGLALCVVSRRSRLRASRDAQEFTNACHTSFV